jgi:hypothetical protein
MEEDLNEDLKVLDATFDPETEEVISPAAEEDIWTALNGVEWPQWPDDQRNMHVEGAKCSLLGKSVVDMTSAEVIMFVGFLDKLCSNQNSMLHYYVKRDEDAAIAAETRDTEINDGPEDKNEEEPDPAIDLDGHTD